VWQQTVAPSGFAMLLSLTKYEQLQGSQYRPTTKSVTWFV